MMSTFVRIRDSDKAPGHDRIYLHGEPEAIAEERARREGIVVTPPVMEHLEQWSRKLGMEPLVG